MSGENGKGSARRQENTQAVRDRWPFEEKVSYECCDNCIHSDKFIEEDPCAMCFNYDEWKPK